MCINKRSIVNQGYVPGRIHSTRFIDINCNHCWQCHLNRVNDVTFRVLHEVLSSQGIPFFVTLTYSDFSLPYLLYRGASGNIERVSVWNRTHFQRYIKRLRRKLEYYFGIKSDAFKYFMTCERGSSDSYVSDSGVLRIATERPHYHFLPLLKVDSNLSPVRDLPPDFLHSQYVIDYGVSVTGFFRYLLNKEWFYGNVDDLQMCRDIVSSVRYVCKYVCKNLGDPLFNIPLRDWLELYDPEFDHASALWFIQSKPFEPDLVFDPKIRKKDMRKVSTFVYQGVTYENGKHYKRFPRPISFCSLMPRCMGSINLGLSFIDNLDCEELFDYMTGKRKVTLPSVKSSSLINLPRYYFRRLCKESFIVPSSIDGLPVQYSRTVITKKSSYERSVFLTDRLDLVDSWDNVRHWHLVSRVRLTTYSVTSSFGDSINRYNFKSYVRNRFATFKDYFRNRSYYLDLLHKYFLLPPSYRIAAESLVLDKEAFKEVHEYFQCRGLCFYTFVKAVRLSTDEYSDYPVSEVKFYFYILKLLDLCQYYLAHQQHLKNDKVYSSSFYSSAFDNPDLFLNHFI